MTETTEIVTTARCGGCSKSVNLLQNHLVVTTKVQKAAFSPVAPSEDFDPLKSASVEEEDENAVVLGTRSGVGEQIIFHSNECCADFFGKRRDKSLRLKLNHEDGDPYNPEGSDTDG